MTGDSSSSSTVNEKNWVLDLVDTWCQHLPSCSTPLPSNWHWSSTPKKSVLDPADNDTVATASTTQVDEEEVESSSSASDEARTSSNKAVSFGSLQVREYERVVDNTIYMGLSLGWDCTDHTPRPIIPLIDACTEQGKTISSSSSSNAASSTAGAGGDTLHVRKKHNGERFAIFLAYGFTRKELKAEANKAAKFWRQRQLELIRKEEEQMALEATTKRAARKKKTVRAMRDDASATSTASSKRRAVLFSMFRH